MLDASRHDDQLAGPDFDLAVAELHQQLSRDDEEELALVLLAGDARAPSARRSSRASRRG